MDNDFISSANVDLDFLWNNILEEIEKTTSALSFDVWIKSLEIVDVKENTIILATQTKSTRDTLLKDFKNEILSACHKFYSVITNLEIIVKSANQEQVDEQPKSVQPQQEKEERVYVDKTPSNAVQPASSRFDPLYTFENFIIGTSNQLACAAAKAVADKPGSKINPLFIYGGPGLGKTHLLYAIGNYITEKNPKLNVIYITAYKFVTDFTNAIRDNKTFQFKDTFAKADVLIIDDIQYLIGKAGSQEQFFNIFNEFHQAGKQIVITSDKQPREFELLEDRLKSRFEWGMIADIGVPDIETRIAILNKKAQLDRCNVSPEVIEYIAEIATTNVRTMEGYLTKAVFFATLHNEEVVTIESAREALKDIAREEDSIIDASKIIATVCKFYNLKKEELLARKRTKTIAEARQTAMFLMTEYLSIPLKSMGAVFGKDHSTVIYARNKVLEDMKKSKKLEVQITDLKRMIEGK